MHLPVLALLAGTMRRHGRLASVGVHLEREVAVHEAQLARVDVVLLQGRQGRREEPLAERTLIVGELDEGHRRVVPSQHRRIGHAGPHGRGDGDSALGRPLAQQAEHLTELVLDGVQIHLDAHDVGPNRAEIALRVLGRLRLGRVGQDEDHQRRQESPFHCSPLDHGWHTLLTQLPDAQSVPHSQRLPAAQGEQYPPQSTSLSLPSTRPSLQCGVQQPSEPQK